VEWDSLGDLRDRRVPRRRTIDLAVDRPICEQVELRALTAEASGRKNLSRRDLQDVRGIMRAEGSSCAFGQERTCYRARLVMGISARCSMGITAFAIGAEAAMATAA
jgi:hypothetical protein